MTSQNHLESFIVNSFRSVWAIEVLQFLVDHPDSKFSPEELNAALRVSDAVVSQSVGNLSAAGLAVVDDDGRISLYKGTRTHREIVNEAIDLYRKSPDKVRRLIVAQSTPGVTAFADAFKLRGD